MGAMPNEPSMEEILSSIKRIIAEEDRTAPAPRRGVAAKDGGAAADDADDHILELTDVLADDDARLADAIVAPAPARAAKPAPKPAAKSGTPENKTETVKAESGKAEPAKPAKAEPRPPRLRDAVPTPSNNSGAPMADPVLSDLSAKAARDSLNALTTMLVRNEDGQSNTLEGLVREILRPMLKEWLDAHLPEIVESMVRREINRITGRV